MFINQKLIRGGVKSLKLKRVCLIIIGIFCYTLLVTGGTYAYYALTASNNSIAGTAGEADLSLEVVNQHPNNEEYLVPQLEKGLATAISSNYNCVDDNNNTVCQVYSIKIANTGTANVEINGTITFGNIDKMPNLKWRLIKDKNTYGSFKINQASNDANIFDNNIVLKKGDSKIYYIVIWIDEVDKNQTDTGKYNATIEFSSSNGKGVTSTVGDFNYMKNISADTFRSDEYREKIKNVSFVDYIDTSNAVVQWDVSELEDNSIVAWLDNNTESGYYDLYIGSKEEIYIQDMNSLFHYMRLVDNMSFNNLNTIKATDMSRLFEEVGLNSKIFTLDLGNKFDTRNVTKMYSMFNGTGRSSSVFTLDLEDKFDTSKVYDMGGMFGVTGYNSQKFKLDLGNKFDTSNVKNMGGMFSDCAGNDKIFTINLGDNFDTKNVTNMGGMFRGMGKSNPNFTLDLKDKFIISKVSGIENLFNQTGYANDNLVLDLSNLTFDSARSYGNFLNIKETQTIYVKSETEKNWILDKNFTGVSSNNVIVKTS